MNLISCIHWLRESQHQKGGHIRVTVAWDWGKDGLLLLVHYFRPYTRLVALCGQRAGGHSADVITSVGVRNKDKDRQHPSPPHPRLGGGILGWWLAVARVRTNY